jgi:hypothetical protein
MNKDDKYLAYLTRPQYLNLKEIHFDTRMYNLDRMIWDKEIYEKNEVYLEDIYLGEGFKIQRLILANFKHYFVLENRVDEYLPLVFWVNTLGISEEEPQQLIDLIACFKYSNPIRSIRTENGEIRKAIHIGNMFNGYVKQKGIPINQRSSEDELYKDVEKYIHGEDTEFEFKYSIFEDFLIIYRAKQKKQLNKIDFNELLGLNEKG